MRTITGNLLEIQHGILAHQVNTLGIMGGGVALSIRQKWPKVYRRYYSLCQMETPEELLGQCQLVQVSEGLLVANLFGQLRIGRGLQTSYEALRRAILSLQIRRQTPVLCGSEKSLAGLQVYFPVGMSCGLAGGDWHVVESILEELIPDGVLVKLPEKK